MELAHKHNYVPIFLWFDHFLYFWAEILTIFLLQLWKIKDIKISFLDKLSFKKKFISEQHRILLGKVTVLDPEDFCNFTYIFEKKNM